MKSLINVIKYKFPIIKKANDIMTISHNIYKINKFDISNKSKINKNKNDKTQSAKNSPSSNKVIHEKNQKQNTNLNSKFSPMNNVKSRLSNSELFLKCFSEHFPLQLNKPKVINIDQNMSSFISLDKIINRVKAVSIAKTFLDNLISKEKDFSNICDETLIKIIGPKLDIIKDFKIEDDDIIKFDLSFNKSFKRTKFNINLYNIKNYMCFGFDPDRSVIKNTKNFQHLADHIIGKIRNKIS